MNWLFISVSFSVVFVVVFPFLLPRSLFFAGKMPQEGSSTSHAACQRLGVSSPSWNTSAQLVKLCTPQCAWLLKRLAFAEVGELTSSWNKNMNCYRTTVVWLDAKGLWKPGQSFYQPAFCRVWVFILWTSCLLINK